MYGHPSRVPSAETRHVRMNIIYIITDQQRYDSLGYTGRSICRTPNLDQLAADGMRFDNAYTVCSLCSPARTSMLTGVYPHTHDVRTNTNNPRFWPIREIPDHIPLISQQLRDAGYNCGYSGKWHCGEEKGPTAYGFEGMDAMGYGNPYVMPEYDDYLAANGLQIPHPFLRDKGMVDPRDVPPEIQTVPGARWAGGTLPGPAAACEPAFIVEHAKDLLERFAAERTENGTPFFQVVSFWGPHHPSYIPEPYASMYDPADIELWPNFVDELADKPPVHDRYRRSFYHEHIEFSEADWKALIAKYWGYCSFIDAEIGKLLETLDDSGLAAETAIVFTTDHGDMTGAHGGLLDKGEFMYEETYHIPLLARVPGVAAAGSVCNALVSNMDIASTALDLAGLPVPSAHQGRSLRPVLQDPHADWREDLMCEFHGLRINYWQRLLRWRQYKYVYNAPAFDELYDLDADPCELTNRIDDPELRDVADECRQRLLRSMRETNDIGCGTAWQHLNFSFDGSVLSHFP